MPEQVLTQEQLMQLIQKAVITTADGALQPAQSVDQFISFTVDQTQLLQQVRTERGIVNSLEINAIDLGDPVLAKAVEATAPTNVGKPSFPKVTLKPVEAIAAFDLSFSWLRKNVRRESANEDINREYARRIGKDMMLVGMQGDTTNVGTTATDKALQILDGLIIQLTADNNVHDYTIPATPSFSGKSGVFRSMLKLLNKDLRDQKDSLIYLVDTDTFDDYAAEIGAIPTAQGTQVLINGTNGNMLRFNGIVVMPIYGMPANTVILTLKQNIVYGFGQNMQVYQQKQMRPRTLEVTIVLEFDVKYFLGSAIVLGQQ